MKSIISSLLFLTKYSQSAGGHWDYDHMDGWSHDYEMCGTYDQSPINIMPNNAIFDTSICSSSLNWTIDYSIHSWKISNNGHSIALQPVTRVDWDPDVEDEATVETADGKQYTTLSLNENSIARLPNYFLPEGSSNTEFCLHSFHFHWGLEDWEGSEHVIDDYQYPMEVHFVHYNCKHPSLGTTLGHYATAKDVNDKKIAGQDVHELAVVGIMFDITNYDNPAFDAILSVETLENIQYPADITGVQYAEVIDGLYLQDIIPDGIFTDGYYAYEGSLTTPPCTNIVRWHVSNSRSYIGKAQMERFRALMSTTNITMAPNYRDVQRNVKNVYACIEPEVKVKVVNETERAVVWVWAVIVLLMAITMASVCYWRSKRAAQLMVEEPLDAKRQRLASRSSFGGAHHHDESHGDSHSHHGH